MTAELTTAKILKNREKEIVEQRQYLHSRATHQWKGAGIEWKICSDLELVIWEG